MMINPAIPVCHSLLRRSNRPTSSAARATIFTTLGA